MFRKLKSFWWTLKNTERKLTEIDGELKLLRERTDFLEKYAGHFSKPVNRLDPFSESEIDLICFFKNKGDIDEN